MPKQIIVSKALHQLAPIVEVLQHNYSMFDPAMQAWLDEQYAALCAVCIESSTPQHQGAAVVQFLQALDEQSQMRSLLWPLLDAAKGLPETTAIHAEDVAALQYLPPVLGYPPVRANGHDRLTAAAPLSDLNVPSGRGPGDAFTAGALPPEETFEAVPPAPTTRSAGTHVQRTHATPPHLPLTRYPEIDCPAHATVGTRTSLSVRLLLAPSDPQTSTATAVSIEDTAQQPPDVEIVLSARGCDIEDSNTQKLQVARDADSAVRFVIVPRQKGEQTIKAEFYQRNRYIGTVERTIQVTTKPRARSTEAPTPPARVLEFASASAVAPDLELRIETDRRNDKILYFTLHSTVEAVDYHHAPVGEVRLKGSPLKKMQAVYKELNEFAGNAPATPAHIAVQRKRLENLGKNLWDELFPAELKAAYWQFREHVKTLLITSDEPWIPWEIVKPYSLENGRIEEPFLCEKFVVARWLAGHGPADRMPIKNLRPVVPPSDLQSVQDELRYLETVNQLRDGIVPDAPYNDRARVIELLESGTFSVLHIAAHGSFDDTSPDNASIELSDGPLCPSDIFARFGGTRPRPLVFLNACHGARTEFAFTGLGGWADRLVGNACVGAFIGAAWEVNDHLALQFAETFYTALLRDNRTIGESFRLARQTIRDAEPSNSTWLAYVLYADPGAMMTR